MRRALTYNFLSGIIAVLGGVISLLIGPMVEEYISAMVPIAAGGFIYIAGSDLLPELTHECEVKKSLYHFISMVCGMAVMLLLALE